MNDPEYLVWLAPLGGLLFFAALWLGVCFGVAGSGWQKFARRYATTVAPVGRYFTARSARVGGLFGSYRNAVRVVFMPEGIHFSVMFLFRPGHRPFMLPWGSLAKAELKRGFLGSRYEIEIRDEAGPIRLWLPLAAQGAMAAARGSSWTN
jgi:hypothetical protein